MALQIRPVTPPSPAGSGVKAVRLLHAMNGTEFEGVLHDGDATLEHTAGNKSSSTPVGKSVARLTASQETDLKLKAQLALEAAFFADSSISNHTPKDKLSSTSGERVRMECNVCGYKSVPQWLNDEAHCLKCQAVLKKRPSVHQRSPVGSSPARTGARRATTPAKASTADVPSSTMVGPERFFYDKTTYTGAHAQGDSYNVTLLSKVSQLAAPMAANAGLTAPKAGDDVRVRMECHVCGYKCVPQWLNDEAHCLKCQAVLRTRPSVHQRSPVGSSPARSSARRSTSPASICSQSRASGRAVGPERFFYDKSTYTGTHSRGGPSPVSKGVGTGFDQSWKRSC